MASIPFDAIIVVAKPQETVSGIFAIDAPLGSGGGPPGGTNIQPLITQNRVASEKSVNVEPDAQDDEIVVVANKVKGFINNAMTVMMTNRPLSLPCIPASNGQVVRAMLGSMKFNVSTRNFGEGRGGENLAGQGTTNIPVNINNGTLKGYGLLGGGINYLVFHEIAHSFPAMRDFAKSQYETWYAREGKGLTGQPLADAYARSAEFSTNEARANTIARSLNSYINGAGDFNFYPPHGYGIC